MLKRILVLVASLLFITATFVLACLAFRDYDAPRSANDLIVDFSEMAAPEPTPETKVELNNLGYPVVIP